MIKQKYIKTTKTARYYILGRLSKLTANVFFVFHGHGQLADDFLRTFKFLEDDKTLIVAPEAMNKFYVRGFTGKIGTTWMTKIERENEIIDYVDMIDRVYQEISTDVDFNNIKCNVLGFSQGGHTAVRWLAEKQQSVKNLILWGSGFPRDIQIESKLNYWTHLKIKIVIGKSDRFITANKLNEELAFLSEQKINYELIKYDGSHEIDASILKKIYKQIV